MDLNQTPQMSFKSLAASGSWISLLCLIADYRLHVLRNHAEQVGPADLPARLHEEPPGLPPWPPRTSVALLQLHVHARRVRTPHPRPPCFAPGNVARRKRNVDPFHPSPLCAVWSSWASTLYCSSWSAFPWRWFMASYGSVCCTWQECSLVRIFSNA